MTGVQDPNKTLREFVEALAKHHVGYFAEQPIGRSLSLPLHAGEYMESELHQYYCDVAKALLKNLDENPEEAENILQEAQRITSGPRRESYGHPYQDHSRTALMWTAILGVRVTAEQVCLCMTALKISRQCHKSRQDNLVDACGYLRNVEMIQEMEKDPEDWRIHSAPYGSGLK